MIVRWCSEMSLWGFPSFLSEKTELMGGSERTKILV
jgi:hypothetical protein